MTGTDLSNLTFVLVDDEEFSRTIVAQMLRSLGVVDLLLAKDGREALAHLEESPEPVSCIIADFRMPHMNGLELLKRVRSGAPGVSRSVAFALLTGHGDRDLVGLALALDVSMFLVKPVSKATLAKRIHRMLNDRSDVKSVQAYDAIEVPVADGPAGPRPKLQIGGGYSEDMPIGDEYRCTIDRVPANAVLARSVKNGAGRIVVGAGTILTPRLHARLREIQDLDSSVEHVWLRRD